MHLPVAGRLLECEHTSYRATHNTCLRTAYWKLSKALVIDGFKKDFNMMTESCEAMDLVPRLNGRHGRRWIGFSWLTLFTLALVSVPSQGALAQTPGESADALLREMSDYLSSVDNLTFDADVDVEAVSHGGQTGLSGQKVQFNSSGSIALTRPGKIRAQRNGGYMDVEIVSDGSTLTYYNRKSNSFAQTQAPATLDALFVEVRTNTGIEFTGADLLFSDVYSQLADQVLVGAYMGPAVIDGTDVYHLAFRALDVDWQIWIEAGDKPIPRKYVVTSKWITGAPQFTLRISNWNDSPELTAEAFAFQPTDGAEKVDINNLVGIGDLPLPVAIGGQ